MACRLAENLGDAFIFGYDRRQLRAVCCIQLFLPGLGKRLGCRTAGIDIRLDLGIANIGIEIGQVPGGAPVRHGSLRLFRSRGAPPPTACPDMGSEPFCRKRKNGARHLSGRDQMPRLTAM